MESAILASFAGLWLLPLRAAEAAGPPRKEEPCHPQSLGSTGLGEPMLTQGIHACVWAFEGWKEMGGARGFTPRVSAGKGMTPFRAAPPPDSCCSPHGRTRVPKLGTRGARETLPLQPCTLVLPCGRVDTRRSSPQTPTPGPQTSTPPSIL